MAATHGDAIKKYRDQYKDTVIWNVEAGLTLSAADLAAAETIRTNIYLRVMKFFEQVDFLVLPVSQVAPFDVTLEYPATINGMEMLTYIDWMKSCYYITVTGLPTISLPFGFTEAGLPVGIQIVGKPQGELELLKFANVIEAAQPAWKREPLLD